MTTCPSCGQLNAESARFCNACGALLAPPQAHEVRKTVTVVFADVTGSTALGEELDAESFRRVMARYFDVARRCLERHGGTVEKFIGDAVMAVFGVPTMHEDDALRALRAAAELRDSLAALNGGLERDYGVSLLLRTGVNTGDVVTGTEERLATGDAVNVAARLEQAAQPGEILIGDRTARLARDAIETEPVEPLSLRGKAEPLAAHRLLRVVAGAPGFERRFDAPLVGRGQELAKLRSAFDAAVSERRCRLVTVLGPPGIGKSRLARELESALTGEATVLYGHCLPYGEGITYWPLVEMFRQAGAESELDAVLSAGAPEEIAWSARKAFERRSRKRPLTLIVEDIHWAEPTFLDLIEHLVDWTRDAPLLVLCLARPELLDERPAWRGEHVALELLSDDESDQLIDELLGDARLEPITRARVREATEGNPLFVEQLLAMLGEGGNPDEVPPTIQALLAARLDALPADERDVLERASVVGLEFEWAALAELASDRRRPAGAQLAALVRKELIRPHEATEDAFGFRHVLIRDAAYERIPKERRASLHERFASYLDGLEKSEREELVGYHLEQAYRFRAELGPTDARGRELAARAAGYLGSAGLRAFGRSDISATVGLLTRACALLPEGERQRLRLLPELGSALGEAGRFDDAHSVLDAAVDEARRAGDRAVEGRARIEQLFLRIDDPAVLDEAEVAVHELVPLFEELGDDQALARVWRLSGLVSLFRSRNAELGAAIERALEHARRAGDEREQGLALFWIPQAAAGGPTPAEEGIRQCEALLAEAGNASAEAGVRNGLGMLYAMVGRADEARRMLRQSGAMYDELGLEVLRGVARMHDAIAELHLGDPAEAERAGTDALEMLERLGERGYRSTAAVVLAQALNMQSRYAEAEEATRLSEQLASADDTPSQVGWRTERARALAHRGEVAEAERLAREAISLAEPTDSLDSKGECALALAEVLRLAGRIDESTESAAKALETWENKGIVGSAKRARALLAELEVQHP